MMVVLVTIYTFMVCISSLALERLLHRVADTAEQYKGGEGSVGVEKEVPGSTNETELVTTDI